MARLLEKRLDVIWNYIKQSNKTYESIGKLLAAVNNTADLQNKALDSVAELMQTALILVLYIKDDEFNAIEDYVQFAGKISTKPLEFNNNALPKLKVLKDRADEVLKKSVNPKKLKEAIDELN